MSSQKQTFNKEEFIQETKGGNMNNTKLKGATVTETISRKEGKLVKKLWTKEEVNFLKSFWSRESENAIAAAFGRTPAAVRTKASTLGLINGTRYNRGAIRRKVKVTSDPAAGISQLPLNFKKVEEKAQEAVKETPKAKLVFKTEVKPEPVKVEETAVVTEPIKVEEKAEVKVTEKKTIDLNIVVIVMLTFLTLGSMALTALALVASLLR